MAQSRSPDPRTATTRPDLPSPRPSRRSSSATELVLESAALRLRPDAAELAWLTALVEELEPFVDDEARADALAWMTRGGYTTAITRLEEARARAPRNVSVQRTLRDVRMAVLRLLERRVGSRHRRVLARQGQGELAPGYARIVELARSRPTLGDLLARVGDDDILTLERIARLASRGWLLVGAASSPSNRP